MSRPLIIGQAPSRLSDPTEPLSERSGARLSDLCGISVPEFLAGFERRNLIEEWPGKAGKGDRFVGLPEARRLAETCREAAAGRRVVVLGFSIAAAFRLTGPSLTFAAHWGGSFAFCPHPSAVSRWWNDPANGARARAFWRELASTPGP